jgi:hypothetical protein
MSNCDKKLLVLHANSPDGDTWLSFREPPKTQIPVLRKRLAEDHYDKPFLVDNRKIRSFRFAIDGAVQSEMRLDEPETLVSAYTRKMMGFLLFRDRPREVVMIGRGGGSLAKGCHRHLLSTRMMSLRGSPTNRAMWSREKLVYCAFRKRWKRRARTVGARVSANVPVR